MPTKKPSTPKPPQLGKKQSEELTPQQDMFCRAYIIDLNATKAALAAGYSEKNAASQGCRLLINPKVQDCIQELMGQRNNKLEITAARVLEELGRLAFASQQDLVSWGPDGAVLKPSAELSADVMAAIQEVNIVGTGKDATIKIKLHNKTDALDKLGQHFKLFTQRIEHGGSIARPAQEMTQEELKAEAERRGLPTAIFDK